MRPLRTLRKSKHSPLKRMMKAVPPLVRPFLMEPYLFGNEVSLIEDVLAVIGEVGVLLDTLTEP